MSIEETESVMWRNVLLGSTALILLVSANGCDQMEDSRIVSVHLIDHFRSNGLKGQYRRVNPESIGAIQGGQYASVPQRQRGQSASTEQRFLLEFAKFDDPKKAKLMEKRGFRSKNGERVYKCYANGVFVMIVRQAPKNIDAVKIFRRF